MRRLFVGVCITLLGCGTSASGPDSGTTIDSSVIIDDGGNPADGHVGPIVEAETTAHANDTDTTAEMMGLGDTVQGTIAAASGGMADVDTFKFRSGSAKLIRITVTPKDTASDYQPYAVLLNEAGEPAAVVRTGSDPKLASREAFLTRNASYYIQVADQRNAATTPANVGSATTTYSVKVEEVTITAQAATVPFNGTGTIAADGKLPIYSFTATSNQSITAETRASRLSPASNVDTVLSLVDATGSTLATIGTNDDISHPTIPDSLLTFPTNGAGKHYIVVDYFDINGSARNFSLSIATP